MSDIPTTPAITILPPPQSVEVRLAVIDANFQNEKRLNEERAVRLEVAIKEVKADLKANTDETKAGRRTMAQQWFTIIGSTVSIIAAQLLINFFLHH